MTFSTISCIFFGVNGKRNPASLAFPNSTNAAFAEAMHSRHSGPGVAVSGALWGKPHYQVFHARSACKTLKLESLRVIVGFATSVMVVDWGLVSVQKRE